MLLAEKVVIVTGGANGMGEAISKRFATEGGQIIVVDVNREQGEKVVQEINAYRTNSAVFHQVDITDPQAIQQMVESTIHQFGQIDVLVNCAGGVLSGNGTSENITRGDWDRVIDLNLNGTVNIILEVLPHMKNRQYGKIVNFSSMGAFNPYSVVLHYHAAKGAIESLTSNLAFELAPQGIFVNVIAPGPIMTPFWDKVIPTGADKAMLTDAIAEKEVPLGRFGTAEDIAGVALFLSSNLSDFVTGEKINVGGGMGNVVSHNSTFLSSKENQIINK